MELAQEKKVFAGHQPRQVPSCQLMMMMHSERITPALSSELIG
jgi:hypothetical protein